MELENFINDRLIKNCNVFSKSEFKKIESIKNKSYLNKIYLIGALDGYKTRTVKKD